MSGRRFKTAFILGAGLGMRLRPLTEHCPKPLLAIGKRPVIAYAMDHLLSVGVDRFVINTHHRPEAYQEKFQKIRQWFDSGRCTEELLREFEKTCQSRYASKGGSP